LEPGDLRPGQVVINRIAVVKLGVNNRSGDGGGCFRIKVRVDTAKLTNTVIAGFGDIYKIRSVAERSAANPLLSIDRTDGRRDTKPLHRNLHAKISPICPSRSTELRLVTETGPVFVVTSYMFCRFIRCIIDTDRMVYEAGSM